MAAEYLIFVADGGEVSLLIPPEEEVNVFGEEAGLVLGQWCEAGFSQQGGEFVFEAHALTDSSMMRGCQQDAAWTNAAKMAREAAECA